MLNGCRYSVIIPCLILFLFSISALFSFCFRCSWFHLLFQLFVCQREGALFIKIKTILKKTGEKNVKNSRLGMLGWPLTLKIEHQGSEVCEGPMRAGCYGSFATILVRVPCLGLYQNTKAALDTKDSLRRNTEHVRVWLFLIKSSIFSDCFCAFRACPSSEGWQKIL